MCTIIAHEALYEGMRKTARKDKNDGERNRQRERKAILVGQKELEFEANALKPLEISEEGERTLCVCMHGCGKGGGNIISSSKSSSSRTRGNVKKR